MLYYEYGPVGTVCEPRESEALGGNVPQYHFVHHKAHMAWPGLEQGPATIRLGYDTALTELNKTSSSCRPL
jgi:hypothetical protein